MGTCDSATAACREGDLVVICRGAGLPPTCMLSGRPAARTVKCYFHWQEQPAHGGPVDLVSHYLQNVWKVTLDIPLADDLLRRRRIGWVLFALTAMLALVTVAGIVFGQMAIARMPAGPEKQWWDDLGVPLIALGGFWLTGLAAFASYKIMPMPTTRLKAIRIDESYVWLAGACPDYLAQLPEARVT